MTNLEKINNIINIIRSKKEEHTAHCAAMKTIDLEIVDLRAKIDDLLHEIETERR